MLSYYIDGDYGQSGVSGDYLATPGMYNADPTNVNGASSKPGFSGVLFAPGIHNYQFLGTVLYGLADANVFQCFGDSTNTANPISGATANPTDNGQVIDNLNGGPYINANGQLIGNFTISPGQFAPTTNIESLAPVMYLAFETTISRATLQQNSNSYNALVTSLSLNASQSTTLTQMQTVFSEMINAVGNTNIHPLLQLSGLYDLLNNDPTDASGGTNYGMTIDFVGCPRWPINR